MALNIEYITVNESDQFPNKEKEEYQLSDCILIRTTEHFPKNRVIQTPKHGYAYDFGSSVIFGDTIIEIIRKKYPDIMSSEEEKRFNEELAQYDIFFSIPRSTVHFTINGLVHSHEYGQFDARPFIILEPLQYHIDDSSLEGLRVEDTYFSDDIVLSNQAIIMIPRKYFEDHKSDLEFLEQLNGYQVCVFDGDEKKAVESVLNQLGYNSFRIGKHGYADDLGDSNSQETKMVKCLKNQAEEKGIPRDKHCHSKIYFADYQDRYNQNEQEEIEYLYYILDNSNIPKDYVEQVKEIVANDGIHNLEKYGIPQKIIELIGLEELKRLTIEFNSMCVEKVEQKRAGNEPVKK